MKLLMKELSKNTIQQKFLTKLLFTIGGFDTLQWIELSLYMYNPVPPLSSLTAFGCGTGLLNIGFPSQTLTIPCCWTTTNKCSFIGINRTVARAQMVLYVAGGTLHHIFAQVHSYYNLFPRGFVHAKDLCERSLSKKCASPRFWSWSSVPRRATLAGPHKLRETDSTFFRPKSAKPDMRNQFKNLVPKEQTTNVVLLVYNTSRRLLYHSVIRWDPADSGNITVTVNLRKGQASTVDSFWRVGLVEESNKNWTLSNSISKGPSSSNYY